MVNEKEKEVARLEVSFIKNMLELFLHGKQYASIKGVFDFVNVLKFEK